MRGRLRRIAVLGTAIAAVTALAAPAIAQGESPWSNRNADGQGTGQATVAGPQDPGLKWHLDFDEVDTAAAPDGYDMNSERILVAGDGTLITMAENHDPQYDRDRFAREIIGIDPDSGEVTWQIDNAGASSSGRCSPAIDDQDRVWVGYRLDDGDRVVAAFDASTGEEIPGTQIDATDQRCREEILIDGDHLVFSGTSRDHDDLRIFDISGTAPSEISVGLDIADAASLANHGNVTSWGVFTDTTFVTLVEIEDAEGDTASFDLVALSLTDGSVVAQEELPTPSETSSPDYDRAALLLDADADTLVVSGAVSVGSSDASFVAGVDPSDLTEDWMYSDLESDPEVLTLGDGAVLFQESGGDPLTAVATADGSLVFDDGAVAGSQPVTTPDGSGYVNTRTSDITRDRLITRFDAQGQLDWQIDPGRIVQEVDGVDTREGLNMGGQFARLQFAAVDADGTLYVTAAGGSGMLAIDDSGGLVDEVCDSFPDVDPNNTHACNIERLAELGITEGDGQGNFNPSGAVTREQFATFLARGLDIDGIEGTSRFDDVQVGTTHAANIEAAAEAGITTGVTATTFEPRTELNRAQLASLLGRALELDPVDDGPFDDVSADSVHAPMINAVAEAGITTGTTATTFDPDGTLTREQMASLLVRALDD